MYYGNLTDSLNVVQNIASIQRCDSLARGIIAAFIIGLIFFLVRWIADEASYGDGPPSYLP